jgi:hypothetical protein
VPDTILALPDPGRDIPLCKPCGYARGTTAAAKGDFTGAEAKVNAIAAIGNRADLSALQAVGVPALAREVLDGRIAQAQGDSKAAIAHFEVAAVLQDGLPYLYRTAIWVISGAVDASLRAVTG